MSLRARLGFGICFVSLLGSACTPAPPGASDGRGAGGSETGTPQGGSPTSSAGGSAGNAGSAGSGTAGGAASGGGTSTAQAPPAPWQAPGTSLISNTAACNASQSSVGRAPLRRISRVEYNNMVRDLLGEQSRPADGFVSEEKVVGFNSNSYTGVNPLIMRQYWDAADKLATTAAANYLNLLGCGSNVTDACIQGYIAKVAKRAYRGNFDDAAAQALFTLYADTKAQFDVQTGVQAVLTQVLTSPRFLFMFEFGQGSPSGTQQPLSSWEVAARLAAFLWRSVPDDTLAQAADQNQLATADQIEAQATRMLGDDKAKSALGDFVDQWLDTENMDSVTKDTVFASVWSPQVAKDLHTETTTTYSSQVSSGASFMDLMTSNTSYINSTLAMFYGVASPGTGFAASQAVPSRKGILTHGSFLSAHAHTVLPSPILRAKTIRSSVMCKPVPPPSTIKDLEIPPAPNASVTGKTTRDLYTAHVANTVCKGCHDSMDPVGFGLGKFDATGRLFADGKENNISVDASGDFHGTTSDLDGKTFSDQSAMIDALAASTQVRSCFALEQFRYALGRIEDAADACMLQQLYADFSGANFNLKKLMISVVRSPAFRTRKAVSAGSACQ